MAESAVWPSTGEVDLGRRQAAMRRAARWARITLPGVVRVEESFSVLGHGDRLFVTVVVDQLEEARRIIDGRGGRVSGVPVAVDRA
jgi:hypothetical protein